MFADIEKSIVRLVGLGGQGVVVGGDMILTASHCIEYTTDIRMAANEDFIECFEANGRQYMASPKAVEPVSDIAVLGEPDNQTFTEQADNYLEFVRSVVPVPIFMDTLELRKPFRVWIRSHNDAWVKGEAQMNWPECARIWVKATEPIEGGASGGPIVNDNGELVGLVSMISDPQPRDISLGQEVIGMAGPTAYPQQALPVWILDNINQHMEEMNDG